MVTAGAWSGKLLTAALKNEAFEDILKPRKGHLLEVEWPNNVPALRHGLMEIGYAKVRGSTSCIKIKENGGHSI